VGSANSSLISIGLVAGCTDYGDPSDNPDPMTCRKDVSAWNSGSLTVFNNFTVADVGFGNSTQSDVIDGNGFTINGVDLENDDSSDSVVGNSRKREGSGYRNR